MTAGKPALALRACLDGLALFVETRTSRRPRGIQEHRPQSVLCLSMSHQGRRTGVLYLENHAASDVFTPTRVELSLLLAYQATIAVENARRYADVQSVTGELRRAKHCLVDSRISRAEPTRYPFTPLCGAA